MVSVHRQQILSKTRWNNKMNQREDGGWYPFVDGDPPKSIINP